MHKNVTRQITRITSDQDFPIGLASLSLAMHFNVLNQVMLNCVRGFEYKWS